MANLSFSRRKPLRTGSAALTAIIILLVAQELRLLTVSGVREHFGGYLVLSLTYTLLFAAAFWLLHFPKIVSHLYFVAQTIILLVMYSLNPQVTLVDIFFLPLAYQAALIFSPRVMHLWVGAMAFALVVGMMVILNPLTGLALPLVAVAGMIVIPAYVSTSQEIEAAQQESEAVLQELQEIHRQLEAHAAQVEELAAIEERNRLERELQDTVSQQIFSISLTARSAHILLQNDPARVPEQLDRMQELTSGVLSQLRTLITQMRPPAST